jgi:GYF domain 2
MIAKITTVRFAIVPRGNMPTRGGSYVVRAAGPGTGTGFLHFLRRKARLPRRIVRLCSPPGNRGKEMSSEFWFVDREGDQQGPIGKDDFIKLIQTGAIGRSSLIWTAGMAEWQNAGEVGAVSAFFGAAAPPPRGLSLEDKQRIEDEERHRAAIRKQLEMQAGVGSTSAKPVKVTSFTDKMNKVGFILWLIIAIPAVLFGLAMCSRH